MGVTVFDPCVHLIELLDGDIDDFSDKCRIEWAGDTDVVACVAFHHTFAVCALKEDLLGNAFVRLKEFSMELCGKLFQHLHAQCLLAVLDLVLALCRRCACTTRIREDMDKCGTHDISQECVCFHEQFIGLARETYDDINAEEYLRSTRYFSALSDVLDLVCKCCGVVATAHFTNNCVASGLERDVVWGRNFVPEVIQSIISSVRRFGSMDEMR